MTISMVSAVWGVMMQLGRSQSGWPSGSGSGIGDVEGGPGDGARVEGGHQGVGVHVRAPGHVDQPGGLVHEGELRCTDDAGRLGGEGQGQEDHQRSREDLVRERTHRHGPGGAGQGVGRRRTTVASTRKGASCSSSTEVMPPPPRMVTRWS